MSLGQAPPPLLAKSGEGAEQVRLEDHLDEVAAYVQSAIAAYRPLWEELFGPEPAGRLAAALVVAALAHDLGKAAEGFQRQLREGAAWGFRHEVLSAALLASGRAELDPITRLAAAAVLTHHRSLPDPDLAADAGVAALPDPEVRSVARARFAGRLPELRANWAWLQAFGASRPSLAGRLADAVDRLEPPEGLLLELERLRPEAPLPEDRESLLLLLARGWLMAADHAVSGGVAALQAALPRPELPPLRPFQKRVGGHVGNAFLEAPTGSGKTFASLLWAHANRRCGERVFYVLPYQASIEAMAETLRGLYSREAVGVLHARAQDLIFLQHFEKTGEYRSARALARQEHERDRFVAKPLKVLTPFQLLKYLFGINRFEIGLSEMTGGLFIFDEIHAYDAHTVALIVELVRFLRGLGARFLFLSATFPPFLRELLAQALGDPQAPAFALAAGEDDATRRLLFSSRHRLRWRDRTLESLVDEVEALARSGRRVLVVANRVGQAQAIYRDLRCRLPGVHLLHSRMARRDRARREQLIWQQLRDKGSELRVLVATQVVEVSLDISFDALYTEVAPADDLLQRMGRVNRYGEQAEPAEVHVAREADFDSLRFVYDLERVQATLRTGPPDGAKVHEAAAADWVRAAYAQGWTARERQRFDRVRSSFSQVIRELRPCTRRPEAMEDFSGLIQTVEVLPVALFDEWNHHTTAGHHLLADQLLVPIPLGALHGLRRRRLVERLASGAWLAHVPYDGERGLTLNAGADLDAQFL